MIIKFRNRDRDGGWTYIGDVVEVQTLGPLTDDVGAPRVFNSRADLVEWWESYWGEQVAQQMHDHFAFLHAPVWRLGRKGCGGDSDAYTIVQVLVTRRDEKIGVLYLGQDEAFLLGDDGKTVDRLR